MTDDKTLAALGPGWFVKDQAIQPFE